MPINVQKWLEEKNAELGLDDNERAAAQKLLNSNSFKSDFVPLPDFHSALDRQKAGYKQKVEELTNLNLQWQDEYERVYEPALKVAQKFSGRRQDDDDDTTPRNYGLSREEVEQMIRAGVEPVRAGSIDFTTFVTDKAIEFRETYKKKFEVAKFRKFAFENREQYPTLDAAFDAFTADDRKAKDEADREQWRKDEREKIRIELQSQANLPEASGDGGAPFFIANTEPDKSAASADPRQAFAQKYAGAEWAKINR